MPYPYNPNPNSPQQRPPSSFGAGKPPAGNLNYDPNRPKPASFGPTSPPPPANMVGSAPQTYGAGPAPSAGSIGPPQPPGPPPGMPWPPPKGFPVPDDLFVMEDAVGNFVLPGGESPGGGLPGHGLPGGGLPGGGFPGGGFPGGGFPGGEGPKNMDLFYDRMRQWLAMLMQMRNRRRFPYLNQQLLGHTPKQLPFTYPGGQPYREPWSPPWPGDQGQPSEPAPTPFPTQEGAGMEPIP